MLIKDQTRSQQELKKRTKINSIITKKSYLRLYSLNPDIIIDNSPARVHRYMSTVITDDEVEQANEHTHNNQDSIANFIFVAVDRDGNEYRFDAQEWSLLGQGADHFVFGNTRP